jgi:uncharacterized membrane protein SpoIIM required for sporulation
MREYRRRYIKTKANKGQAVLNFVIIGVLIGFVIGIIKALTMDYTIYNNLYISLRHYIISFEVNSYNNLIMFSRSFFKYSAIVFSIWVFGFIPMGGLLIFLLLVFRGLAYGHTIAFIMMTFGLQGVFVVINLFLIQFIILIPTYIYVAYNGINYILYTSNYKKDKQSTLDTYMKPLFIGILCCIIVASFETFITPAMIGNLT